jgi:hypothetical protein
MSRAFSDTAFTPTVRAVQTRQGSRAAYEKLDHTDDRRETLTERETRFIAATKSALYSIPPCVIVGSSSTTSTRRPPCVRHSASNSASSSIGMPSG